MAPVGKFPLDLYMNGHHGRYFMIKRHFQNLTDTTALICYESPSKRVYVSK